MKEYSLLYLASLILINGTLLGCAGNSMKNGSEQVSDPWDGLEDILAQIQAPEFPERDYNIIEYGAKENGHTDNSEAIKAAIEACSDEGGGRVIIPEGNFNTGPIYLKSNVNLHLEKGARLLFSTEPKDYLPLVHTRWEGVELMIYSPR